MLKLPVSLDNERLEHLISESTTRESPASLELPINTDRIAFGGYAAATQAVNTWYHSNKGASLKFKSLSSIEDLIKDPHKFTALMMAQGFEVAGLDQTEIKRAVYPLAKKAIETQSTYRHGQRRGRLCWYSFVDHSTKGFDRNFYITSTHEKVKIRNEEQIASVIKSMVTQSSTVAGGGELLFEQDVSDLGRMIDELFINTHEHGSRDQDRRVWIKPATRLIYTYGINLTDKAMENVFARETWLEPFVSGLRREQVFTRHFIEISLVDSGLGYCGRWLADHPDIENNDSLNPDFQYDILKKCFEFSRSSTSLSNKGHGLTAVMQHLTKLRGFLKIRSNRLSVYRDFVNSPFSASNPCYEFSDWTTKESCTKKVTQHAEARGVAITVLIPLKDKNATRGEVK